MVALGIDFGTSTTIMAVCHEASTTFVKDRTDKEVIPSVIAFTPSGRVEVGDGAKARRLIDPRNTLYSVKRILGRSWTAQETARFRQTYPFEMERGLDGMPRFVTRLGKLTATEVASHMLVHLRELLGPADMQARHVCVTAPASFKPDQHQAMIDAAEKAAFTNVSVVQEPYAAAIPYLSGTETARVAVYDLGGGTFDLAVLECQGGTHRVLGAGGDPYLGGDDIDQRLAEWASAQILSFSHWDVRSSHTSAQALLFACERAKIRLSETAETLIPLGQVDAVLTGQDLRIQRQQLELLCADLIQRTFAVCDHVLAQAGVRPSNLDMVIMAGGGSYLPQVREAVAHYFGREPRWDLPPDRIVAQGAAMLAEREGKS